MRLIVDTNIFISALIKDSLTRRLLFHIEAELFTLRFSQSELQKHYKEIMQKTKITADMLRQIQEKIYEKIIFLDDITIYAKLFEAKKIMDHIDPNDTPFIAAALALQAEVWSDDKHFNQQQKIKVWKTRELLHFLL